MAIPTVVIEYPSTAIKPGTIPVSGTLQFTYDPKTDVLDAWVKIPDATNPKVWLTGEFQIDPGVVSEVGIADLEYLHFSKYQVPSRIRLKKFKTRWIGDMPYAASIIASYFGTTPAPIRANLTPYV